MSSMTSPQHKLVGPKSGTVTDYWVSYYLAGGGGCGLCGNNGVVDTRKVLGEKAGIRAFCICPNGQILRAEGASFLHLVLPD